MSVFRRVIYVSKLPNVDKTLLYFNEFYNIIVKCIRQVNTNFCIKRIKTKCFLCVCYIIDFVLHDRLFGIKTMQNLIDWNEISSIGKFFQKPYKLNSRKLADRSDNIHMQSNKCFFNTSVMPCNSNTITSSAPQINNEKPVEKKF